MSEKLSWKELTPEEAEEGTHLTVWSVCSESVPGALLNATAACIYDEEEEADMLAAGCRLPANGAHYEGC